MRLHLCHDGSFDGFLTAVFMIYENRWQAQALHISSAQEAPDLFSQRIPVLTNPEKVKRVWQRLCQLWDRKNIRYFLQGYLYDCPERDDTLYRIIRTCLTTPHHYRLNDYTDPDMLTLSQWVKSVHRETHRMKAFVRFAKAADGVYCAPIAPDFDVLPLTAPFFARRYADQAWLIADMRREYAISYDTHRLQLLALDAQALHGWQEQAMDADEPFYQRLWQDYFRATNIQERANRRLHLRHVPLRYWRYLTEKQTILSEF